MCKRKKIKDVTVAELNKEHLIANNSHVAVLTMFFHFNLRALRGLNLDSV